MKANKGFTLVEILIVVVILGILAAIVIPQFTEASTDAKVSSLVSDLQTCRSQIELYKIQHTDRLPGQVYTPADGATAAATAATFKTAMLTYSDKNGATNATKTDVYKFGPYLQKIPTNPFTATDTIVLTAPTQFGTDGWSFNVISGVFYSNTDQDGDDAAEGADEGAAFGWAAAAL